MGKIKARDIILGWPRGRSTADMWPDWKMADMLEVFRPDQIERIAEAKLDAAYHEGQQEMVNRFIERWRTLDLCFQAKLRPIVDWVDQWKGEYADYGNFSMEAIQKSLKMINDDVQRITGATDDQMAAAWHESATKFMDINFMELPK